MIMATMIALPIVVSSMLMPRGVVAEKVEPFLNGTLTTYRRVAGMRALRAWWNGELEGEPHE